MFSYRARYGHNELYNWTKHSFLRYFIWSTHDTNQGDKQIAMATVCDIWPQ